MERRLTVEEIERLDPYQFMAEIGKKVIHPGGSRSTNEMLRIASLRSDESVLEIGCGVGTTAVRVARDYNCKVTAADIDDAMLEKAQLNVRQWNASGMVNITKADIQALPFENDSFTCVFIEAVTMFTDRERSAGEVVRVCRNGGRVIDHEFIWKKPPTLEAKRIFEGEVCPGINFDTAQNWVDLYKQAGLKDIQITTGPFEMMTPAGFIRDEGPGNMLMIMLRCMSRFAYMKKMAWLMSRMIKAMPYLGYVVIAGKKG